WTGGHDLDWDALGVTEGRTRVSLPGYPFARVRHWLPSPEATRPLPDRPRLHPLVHENRSSFFEQRFTTVLGGDDPVLADHVVGGRRVLPGAATLEMARLAGALSLDHQVVAGRDVLWLRQIEAAGDDPVEVTVRLFPEESSVLVRVSLDDEPVPERRVCMEARIDIGAGLPPAETLDLPALVAACDHKLPGADGYAAMAAAGLV